MSRVRLNLMVSLVIATSLPAVTVAEPGIEGRELAQIIFDSMDTDAEGAIDGGQIEHFRDSVFAGMDYDGDGRVTYLEFGEWDPGFRPVAAELGREDAYMTASKIVFAFWDRDGNGSVTDPEMRFAMTQDVRRADLDNDGRLTRDEFMQGFPIIVAMRAAIRPDL